MHGYEKLMEAMKKSSKKKKSKGKKKKTKEEVEKPSNISGSY